jgi:ATP/ADP translocase
MKEKSQLLKSFNIMPDEVTSVLLLIAQSVFLGIFYGTFDIGAHTLFLKTFPDEMIPKAYIISGIIGIILTSIFSKFQSKIKFSKLANATLLIISIIIVLLRVTFVFTNAHWIVFLVFILLGPLNILAILSFWGTVGRIFNLRQGKRLYGIIDSGQVFGIILSSYAIPLILVYLKGTDNLLIISAASIVFAMIIEIILTRLVNIDTIEDEKSDNEILEEQVKIRDFIKNPYILFMALFVIFSMFAAFFVQYSFLVVINEKYPIEEDLAGYLGFFTGSMMFFILIIKTFVYSKLVKTYGLKVSLMLSSLLLLLFTGIAIIVGFASGYEKTAPGFIYFFLFISMSKLFNKTLKDALEVPSFKILYQSLKKSIRFDVQAKIDGTINEISALTSGILLTALSAIVFIKLIHFSVFLFILLIIWLIITIRLYKEYRNSLEQALKQDIATNNNNIEIFYRQFINHENIEKIYYKLDFAGKYIPSEYLNILKHIADNYSQEYLKNINIRHYTELFLLNFNNETDKNLTTFFNKNKKKYNANLTTKEIEKLLKTENKQDVISGMNYLLTLSQKNRVPVLSSLLRVPDNKVKYITIRICGILHEADLINSLVDFLNNDKLLPPALISLKQMPENSVKTIIQMYYKTDISLVTQLAIIEICGTYYTQESINFLLDNISSHRKEIKEKAIECLRDLNYTPKEKDLPKMFRPITEVSQNMAWIISAQASLNTGFNDSVLANALQLEYEHHSEILFNLLSITYNATSVYHVKKYLESGTTEGMNYALELFELFLSEEIKPMILTLFEDVSYTEKTKLLETFFPVKIVTPQELMLNIINRDPNLISKQTKTTALFKYQKYFKKLTDDIIAQLFNPDEELQKAAANIVKKSDMQNLPVKLNKRISPKLLRFIKSDKELELPLSLFNIELNILNAIGIKKHQIVELTDYTDVYENIDIKYYVKKEYFSNYLLFLEISKSLLPEIKIITVDNISDLTEAEYLICIKYKKTNELILIHKQLIKLLLSKL